MARERRIEFAGAIYHVMARGNRRGEIVLDDHDRQHFVETPKEAVEANGRILYARVLMNNHYHFFVQDTRAQPGTGNELVLVFRK